MRSTQARHCRANGQSRTGNRAIPSPSRHDAMGRLGQDGRIWGSRLTAAAHDNDAGSHGGFWEDVMGRMWDGREEGEGGMKRRGKKKDESGRVANDDSLKLAPGNPRRGGFAEDVGTGGLCVPATAPVSRGFLPCRARHSGHTTARPRPTRPSSRYVLVRRRQCSVCVFPRYHQTLHNHLDLASPLSSDEIIVVDWRHPSSLRCGNDNASAFYFPRVTT